MKNIHNKIIILCLIFFFTGCKTQNQDSNADLGNNNSETIQELEREEDMSGTEKETLQNSSEESDELKSPAYQKITGEEAFQIMQDEEDYIILDVRTEEEFKENRIEGAILIPDYEIGERAETELKDKDQQILIYCRSGRRSADTANVLVALGYTNVYDFGGIIDWKYETIND